MSLVKLKSKTGVLLINLGTPEAPTAKALKPYLNEFLNDKRVISIPTPLRRLLVNGIILNTRPKQSAEAYEEIWTENGSPLRIATEALTEAVAQKLKSEYANVDVRHAMRYGTPSIESVMVRMMNEGVDRFVVMPLYPQYASSSTGTALEEVYRVAASRWVTPSIEVVPPFFNEDAWLDAQVAVAQDGLKSFGADHVLFSFHGVPVDHLTDCDATGHHCQRVENCCGTASTANNMCYGHHCNLTAQALAKKLGLPEGSWSYAYQSRLGRSKWIGPYTDEVVVDFAKNGVKRLAMFSPAFIADCLETIEELGIRAKEDFLEAGGEDFHLAPCVNASSEWVEGCVKLLKRSSYI